MGRSLRPANREALGAFARGLSRFVVQGAIHTVERDGRAARHTSEWQIGSGNHASGFLVRIFGMLFQSPIVFYPAKNLWDVAPGYEAIPRVDFNRRVTADCLGCHTSSIQGHLAAIGCERCHGDGNAHMLRPSTANIANPAKLNGPARDSICEQCHLAGVARIPVVKAPLYEPGQRLEDSLAIFVQPANDLRVVSHVEQLALSKCSPRLWCGTCHTPHGKPVKIDEQCTSCHTKRAAGHPSPDAGCPSCHMPKRTAVDGLHTAFTDHRIARPGAAAPADARLRAWRASPQMDRAEGLALFALNDFQGSFRKLSAAYPKYPKDPEVLAALGFVLYLKDQYADAAKLLDAAIGQQPSSAPYHQKLALVRRAMGEKEKSEKAFEDAIRLDPLDESNYHLLADMLPERRVAILERYLKVNPSHLATREALGRP